MKIKPTENMLEEEIEWIVVKKFQEIIQQEKLGNNSNRNKESNQGNEKQKKRDKNNWKAESIKWGGGKMVQQLNSTE